MNSAAAAALSPAPARRRAIAMWPLGVIACAGFGIWGPASWAAVASFSVLASGSLVALAIGWKEQGRRGDVRAATLVDNEPASESVGGPLESLLVDVLPVWQSHVGQVKSQTEQAITQLVISFASITAQFEAAGFKGAHGDSSGVEYSLLTLCERELQPVIAVMTEILDSKKLLTACVHDLSSATAELSSMAAEVAHIAWHTNLLAINAAVEAAHAGDSGRGFGVIAKEIRSLSQTSAAAGKRIAGRIGEVERLMGSAIAVADETEANDRIVIDMSARVIADVLSHVRELGEGAEAMRAQGNVIRADTENLLVNLQFQDRVSQMTVVIDQDIERLHQLVVAGEAIPTSDAWLRELDLHYTMDDQRQSAASPTGATAAAVADDVLFF